MTEKYKEYVAGGASGVIRIIFGYPIETIKIRMQTTEIKANYSFDIRGLYKGSIGVFGSSFITTAIEFGVYEQTKNHIDDYIENYIENYIEKYETKNNLIFSSFLAGGISGICQVPITTPVELIRNRLQTVSNLTKLGKFDSLNLYQNILQTHGIKALYKGTGMTILRDSIGTGIYFTSYELAKKYLKYLKLPLVDENGYLTQSIAGAAAGLGFWSSIYPIDVIKNNIQIDNFDKPMFKNSVECAKIIYNNQGIKGFYKGFIPCMFRSIPVHIGIFSSYKYVIDNIEKTTLLL